MSSHDLSRLSAATERATGLVERGRELAQTISGVGFSGAWAGEWHAIALDDDGFLWAWGLNESGQLGLGDTDNRDRPAKVDCEACWASGSAGLRHTLALRRDGSLWAWGWNGRGRLGLGGDADWYRPVHIGRHR